jgi:hypothetical protein
MGRLVWDWQRFVEDPETGKRVSRANPEHEWITTEVSALRNFDDATLAKVQALKARFAGWAGNTSQTKKRLLSGLITYACCGGTMTVARRDFYHCNTRREKGKCDAKHGIAATDLEARVLAVQDAAGKVLPDCPSSGDLRPLWWLRIGGTGSSGCEVRQRGRGAASAAESGSDS